MIDRTYLNKAIEYLDKMPKYCVDCARHLQKESGISYCQIPIGPLSLVTKKAPYKEYYCVHQRKNYTTVPDEHKCGPEGRLYINKTGYTE